MTPREFKERLLMMSADNLSEILTTLLGDSYQRIILEELVRLKNPNQRFSKTSAGYAQSITPRLLEAAKYKQKLRKRRSVKAEKLWQHFGMLILLAEETSIPATLDIIKAEYGISITPQYFRRLRKEYRQTFLTEVSDAK